MKNIILWLIIVLGIAWLVVRRDETLQKNDSQALPPEMAALFAEEAWEELTALYVAKGPREDWTPAELAGWARVQEALEDWEGALESVGLALDRGLRTAHNREIKARCLIRLRHYPDARAWLAEWRRRQPKHPEALFLSGALELEMKNYEQGLDFLHAALGAGTREGKRAHRLLADTYMHLGLEAREAGDLPLASQEMEVAVQLDPENGAFHHALGRVYLRLKRWPEALDALDLAHTHGVQGRRALTSLLDDLYTAHHKLAAVALLQKDYKKAIRHARLGLEWVTTGTARERLQGLLQTALDHRLEEIKEAARQADEKEQQTLWRQAFALEPTDPEVLWHLSTDLKGEERKKVDDFVLASPWGFQARLLLAQRALAKEDSQRRQRLLLEAWQIGSGLERLRLEEKLFAELPSWPEAPATDPWGLLWRWRAQEGSPAWNEMEEEVEKALPERWFIWVYRAQRHRLAGRFGAARAILHELPGLDPPERSQPLLQALQW